MRNDQGLLTKSDRRRDDRKHWLGANQMRDGRFQAACYRRRPWKVRSLHAFGADDTAPRALALRQILFFERVTFAEHKLAILG